jgi:DNA polymerase (family 10)
MTSSIDLLHEIQRLLELNGENPFKIRAFEKAAQSLAGREDLLERAKQGTLTGIPGVGKGIAEVLKEFLLEGSSSVRDQLLQALPAGLLELTEIPGVGAKKARVLIESLGIGSVAELEYACKENRLLKLKGFGPKLQQKILEGILFQKSNQGFQRISDAFPHAEAFLKEFQRVFPNLLMSETGALRRRCEVLSSLEFLLGEDLPGRSRSSIEPFISEWNRTHPPVLPIQLSFCSSQQFGYELARTTGSANHWKALGNPKEFEASSEELFYEKLGLPWIPPETRETGEEVQLAREGYLEKLLPWNGIRGVFHNHTTRSDGSATLEEMVAEAEKQGFDYIGISDHSQSAFYAQGLKTDDLLEQEKEIRKVQEKHPKIRVFWGIESDILADGSLDYEPKALKRFDFVIASIHSRFNMDRETMTQRILTAIRNPATRFLGHPTGRLLLGRQGYDVDMEAVIAEAAKHQVAVEMNSNPARLDFDWRLGTVMRQHEAFTSVNPDAHETAGLKDTRYGIAMVRKALLSTDRVVNSKSTQEVEKWLKRE